MSDISAAFSVSLQRDCSCSLSVRRRIFSCTDTADSRTVVFLAELHYSSLAGVDIPSLLNSWISSGPTITVSSIQLQVDTTCPVVIDSLQPQSCSVAPNVTVIAVAVGVTVLAVVIITVAMTILLAFCRKQSSYMTWYVPMPHLHYTKYFIQFMHASFAGLQLMLCNIGVQCDDVYAQCCMCSLLALQV